MLRRPHLVPLLGLMMLALPAPAQTVPTGFVNDVLQAGLASPHDFCFLPDGRTLIAEASGTIKVRAGGAPVSIGAVASVQTGGERGLLAVIPDPDFNNNGYIYTWSSRTFTSNMVLARHTLTGSLVDPTGTNLTLTDEHILINNAPDFAFNHNGGAARFGPDGMLYVTIGDDASACSAQSNTSFAGVLLRLDVSSVPPGPSATPPAAALLDPGDNPNSGVADGSRLVFAKGLRNPWRMEIDQVTGNIYIGDVGAGAREEFDELVYPTGALSEVNFGWPWREGLLASGGCGGGLPGGLIDPIVDVGHNEGWFAGMGGPRYRLQGGPFDLPASYEGDYFYSDYYSGELRRLKNNAGVWSPAPPEVGQPSPTDWGTGFDSITALRQGPDGAMYYTRRSGFFGRIRPEGPVDGIQLISGGDQYTPAGEAFSDPIVVRATDPMGSPLPGATVNFTITGPGSVSPPGHVVADMNGIAQATVTALDTVGGVSIVVTATTPGGTAAGIDVQLYRRNLRLIHFPAPGGIDTLIVQIQNHSPATPPDIVYTMALGDASQPPLLTFLGPLCVNPFSPVSFVFEDPFALFTGFTTPGGSTGTPDLSKTYLIPNSLFAGQTIAFLAVGYDASTGGFHRTDCEVKTF